MALTEQPEAAIQAINAGMNFWRSAGASVTLPLSLPYLATAYANLGQFDDAWRTIREALTLVETTKEQWGEAEVQRIAGEIALKSAQSDKAEVLRACTRGRTSTAGEILGTPRRNEPRAPLARAGQGERSARTVGAGLRVVYGGFRHAKLCRRFHFFKRPISTILNDPDPLKVAEGLSALSKQGHYLGYVVARPVQHAPLCRVVLAAPPSPTDTKSDLLVRSEFSAHLLGATLNVVGTPFTQQVFQSWCLCTGRNLDGRPALSVAAPRVRLGLNGRHYGRCLKAHGSYAVSVVAGRITRFDRSNTWCACFALWAVSRSCITGHTMQRRK